ncbi:hypothetical protein L915_17642 [Phytophthora nicotianae]|uniref:Uncharacterized protein n=2 Tax=Phytophthora nicotianae TaxID=4792 RepID=W2FYF8_PHYNI|nr:hypothetical protein L915_17642 [Phytophthora nicotianae]
MASSEPSVSLEENDQEQASSPQEGTSLEKK